MRDGQGRGGKGDLHAVPRSAFCRPHTQGLWLLGAHPHAAGARCCLATPRLSPRAHPSGSPQGPPAAQLGPLACISLGHSLSPGARTLNPCSATVPTGHQSPLPCSSPQQPRERPSWCRVQPHGPSSLCPLGEGVGIPAGRQQGGRSHCAAPHPRWTPVKLADSAAASVASHRQGQKVEERLPAGAGPGRGNVGACVSASGP